MNACYFLEPTGMKTRWQVLQSTNARMKEMLFEVRCLKSNEDMILALAGQFKQLLKFKTIA